MRLFYYIGFIVVLFVLTNKLAAQTTTFTADPGQWSQAGNWSNGTPNSTTDAIIDGECRTSFGGGFCKNLEILSGIRLLLGDGILIVVLGELNLQSTAVIKYNGGELQLSGDILLNNVKRIEVGGALQFVSNFDIGQ